MAKPNIKKEISIAENLAEERLTLIIKKEEKVYANVGSVLHTDTIKEKSSFGSDSIDSTKLRGSTSLQSDNIQKDQLDTSSDYGDYDSVFRPRHYPPKYKIGSTIDEIVVDRKLNYDRKSDRGEITATTSDEEDNADRMLTHPLEQSISQGLRIDNQAFPPTIGEFFSQKPQKCPRYYQFPAGTSNKFRISIATLDRLIKKGQSLQEVSLSMKKAPLPDVTKLSREEIVLMLANRNLLNQVELLKALDDNRIEHFESFYTKNVYVRNCDWNTLYKISRLVSELNYDLTVSGGGDAEYAMDVVVGDAQLIGPEQQHDTITFHEQIISSCPPHESDRSVKVGIIDSGCSSTLYNRIVGDGNVAMHHSMIDATHPDIAEVPYRDCFSPRGIAKGHGTAVVEIVSKCVVAKTEIYVVSLGYPINPMNFGDALLALFERGVTVFNFSLTIELDDETRETIDVMKCKGVVFVAAAGNRNINDWSCPDHITSDLQDGKSIIVGSHNNSDEISEFSIGKCEADVCCLGENIYVENPWHQIRQGTSFATPHVTAVVANFVSHFQHDINETAMWEFLTESSSYLVCHCKRHGGKRIKMKLNPIAVMQHALRRVPEAL